MKTILEQLLDQYKELGIDQQIDYDKFYLYSLITHSTAIEGSTITELENQIMFDQGVSIRGKSIVEQNMNLDLKIAYEKAISYARNHTPYSIDMLIELSSLVMKNTGHEYNTALGSFSSARGELRLLNVTAGVGGKSYMNYNKVPERLKEFCKYINEFRAKSAGMSIQELYNLSFDAHYNLVTIHPWADGNGRMARLIMNQLQFEFGLVPSKILKSDKEDYIKAIIATRESGELHFFREFMIDSMVKNLKDEMQSHLNTLEDNTLIWSYSKNTVKKIKSRKKILNLLSNDGSLTAASLAKIIGISQKGVEKQIAILKSEGLLERIGPDKGGHWKVK